MSTLHVENLKGLSSGGNANKIIVPSGQTLEVADNIRHDDLPSGSVLQVIYGEYHTASTSNFVSTVFAPMTTAQATITPKFSNSKILVHCNGTAAGTHIAYDMSWHLKRGSSWIGGNNNTGKGKTHASGTVGAGGTAGSEVPVTLSFNYLDSPATTSATTYILGFQGGETATYYINRGTSANYTQAYNFYNSGGCTITLMEIKQ